MPVYINGRTAVHAGSQGVLTTKDPCKTPPDGKVVTYTNLAYSADTARGAASVRIENNPQCNLQSIFKKSTGDEAGRMGGVSSGTIQGIAEFVTASPDVFIEGIPAVRHNDLMVSNNRNTAPAPLIQPNGTAPVAAKAEVEPVDHTPEASDVFEMPSAGTRIAAAGLGHYDPGHYDNK